MPIKTLLVDDESSLLEQAEIFLEKIAEDIEVLTASSAERALKMMEEEDFDLIVSDYQMPDMDGLEFLEEIKEERGDEIPFIMFTGKGREKVAMNALNLGADRYLQKGGDPKAQYEVLVDAIKQEFEHRGAEEKIVELNSLLRSLSNVNRLIGEEDDLKTLIEKAAVELVETRNYQNMEISLLDRKDDKIKPVASSGVHPEKEWEVTNDGSGDAPKCVKEVVRNNSTHLVNNPEEYCTDCEYMDELKYHNTLLVPITHTSELTGIISACHRSRRDLSEEEVELLEKVGRDLGFAREKIIVENKLEESEEEFKNLAEKTSVPIAIYQDEYWVYANPATEDIWGYSLEELKEMKYWEIVAPEYREMVKKQMLEKEELEAGYEIKIITKEGEKKWVYLNGSDIDYKGEPAGLISVIDITEKKKKEEELQKTKEELKKNKKRRKLDDFAVEMESIDDEERLYELTIDASKRILNFEICSLDIVVEGEFEVKAPIGDEQEKGTRYPIGGLAGKSYRKGECLLIRDIEEEEDAKTKRESYKSAMSVPVGNFGVFMVWSEQKGDFDEKDLELAETLIHHTKLVLNRIKSEEKLRKSEEKYRTIFESANDAIVIMKNDRVINCNENALEMFGYDREDFIDKTPYEFLLEKQPDGSDSREIAKEKINKALEGEPQEFEGVQTTKDGTPLYIEASFSRYMIDGERFIMAIIRDITEQKEAEEKLREAKKNYQELFEKSGDAFFIHEPETGEILNVNEKMCEMYGYEPEEIIGKTVEVTNSGEEPYTVERAEELIQKAREEGAQTFEWHAEKKSGELFWVEVTLKVVEIIGDRRVLATVRDITKRKEAEEKLRKSEQRFDLALRGAELGVWDWNVETDEVKYSDQWAEMLGYSPDEIEQDLDSWEKRVHPDEKPRVKEELQKHLDGEKEIFKTEHRMKTKSGDWIWVKDVGKVFERDENGEPIRATGILEDITDRKKAEKREIFLHSLLRHDVGNKNQTIRGYLQLMRDHDLPDEVKEFVEKAEGAAEDNADMIEKIRKLGELDEDEEIDEIDLKGTMEKVLAEHRDQLEKRNINIDLSGCEERVKGGTLLKELFSNLVENSIQHSGCDNINISSHIEEDECVVTVEDDGTGISDEVKGKIFDKGFKSGETAGTGLGLYMVREIAKNYGGSVVVKDSDIGGVEFDVRLKKTD
ncbi:MAG: PAS domain S-box protein [Candidatus Thermoplasmatota archaeon]